MSTLNPNIPTDELAGLMTTAVSLFDEFQVKLLTPQLLFQVFLQDPNSTAHKILRNLQKIKPFNWDDLERRTEMAARHNKGRDAQFNFTDDFGKDARLDEGFLVAIDEALALAKSRDELKASSGYMLAVMAQTNVSTYGMLQRVGITSAAIIGQLDEIGSDGEPIIHDYVDEARQGQAASLYQRTDLLNQMLTLLALSHNKNIILVGPEGSGRRSLAYSLAQIIAEQTADNNKIRSLVEINESALLENPLGAVRAAMRRATGGILFVPAIERFFLARATTKHQNQINQELRKTLLNDSQTLIATATPTVYNKLINDQLIRENTNRLDVPPASKAETLEILAHHRVRFEQEYEIEIDDTAFGKTVDFAYKYYKSVAMPASAMQIADRACAIVSWVTHDHNAVLPEVEADGKVDEADIMYAASQITKLPLNKLGEDDQTKYANMVEQLHKRIIGQEEAVLAVSRAVKTARVGLRKPKRPIGSFIFLGPSGVGKSELAKALAEFMFGSEDAMLVLDMSEYQGEASVNRLIGSPPGYVGHDEGGQLTNFVLERPSTVILFDEVEKAHKRIFDVLLQVLEEGRLTDSKGRVASFSETVVIMTSNMGSEHMLVPVITDIERNLVMDAVHRFFRPEFLNRLDDVIMFHQLAGDQLAKILDLMLRSELKLAAAQDLHLDMTPEAKEWLLAQNDQPQYGARPLRRIIARHLREPLADFLLSASRPEGETKIVVGVDSEGEKLSFNM
ncbi:MAG: AAA family ATPase [Chloroflexota bacterium]